MEKEFHKNNKWVFMPGENWKKPTTSKEAKYLYDFAKIKVDSLTYRHQYLCIVLHTDNGITTKLNLQINILSIETCHK